MFQDMGRLPAEGLEELRVRSRAYLVEAVERGEYVGWLASGEGHPETIVAGAGVQLRRVLPHPVEGATGAVSIAEGRHGIVLNVFTEPA